MIKGYTTGAFDLFHVGHLRRLKGARSYCDYLVVGVSTDECVANYKRSPIVPFDQRIEIIRSLRYVDEAVAQIDLDKFRAWQDLRYDVLILGEDQRQYDTTFGAIEKLKRSGVTLIQELRLDGVSTTDIIERIRRSCPDPLSFGGPGRA